MNEVQLKAHAKINLALDVVGRRPNGYHDVKMIMQSISLADMVTVRKTSSESVLTSNINNIPLNGNNIALKAWKLMKEHFEIPGEVHIHLEKHIPVEAGLAGGSSNAAAVLKAVNILYDLGLTTQELARLGVELGADVPFCVMEGTALAEGIGELLTPLTPPARLWMVLVNPGFGVSTAEVYKGFQIAKVTHKPDIKAMIHAISNNDVSGIIANMGNVLEDVTLPMYPEVSKIKEELRALETYPLMSGSGPTVFAIAENEKQACEVVRKLHGKWKTIITTHTI